jgi:hypothetical protein
MKKIFFALLLFSLRLQAHELSICAIFKDDIPYLKEWIEFHLEQGVEHFYLYDNNPNPENLSSIHAYIQNQVVDIIPWRFSHQNNPVTWAHIQCDAYMDCLKKNRNCNWIAFIDTDEFLFSPKKENLRKILKNYEKFAGVCVNWVMYGTSGVDYIPENEKMLNLLVYRAPLDNLHIKSIVQPKYVIGCRSMHFFEMSDGKYSVTENKEHIYGPFSKTNSVNNLRINHYWSRDKKFFEKVKIPRMIAREKTAEYATSLEASMNQQYDPILAE